MNAKEAREKLNKKRADQELEYKQQLQEWVDSDQHEKNIDKLIVNAINENRNWTYYELKDDADAVVDKVLSYCESKGYTVKKIYGGTLEEQYYKLRIRIEF